MRLFLLLVLRILAYFTDAKVVLPLKYHRRAEIEKLRPREKLAGAAPLYDYFNDFFSHQVLIGTPPQTLILRPDTSSSDLWFMDKNRCREPQCTGFKSLTSNYNRTLFDSTKSSSYMSNNQAFSSTQPNVCFNGTLSSDKIALPNFGSVTQQFGLCYNVDPFMGLHPFDGYLGLAFPSLATDNVTPLFQNMIAQGLTSEPVFSVYFANDNNLSITHGVDTAGSITYGGLDTYNCDTNIAYVPLSSTTYWQFAMSSFTFGTYTMAKTQQAIVSTAQAVIILPDPVLQQILPQIGAVFNPIDDGAQWAVLCAQAPNFPQLTFNIGGMKYMIPGPSYVQPINATHCALRVMNPTGFGYGPQWVLGTPFIRNYCVHHDVGNSRLGFSMQTPMHICC